MTTTMTKTAKGEVAVIVRTHSASGAHSNIYAFHTYQSARVVIVESASCSGIAKTARDAFSSGFVRLLFDDRLYRVGGMAAEVVRVACRDHGTADFDSLDDARSFLRPLLAQAVQVAK